MSIEGIASRLRLQQVSVTAQQAAGKSDDRGGTSIGRNVTRVSLLIANQLAFLFKQASDAIAERLTTPPAHAPINSGSMFQPPSFGGSL